MSKLVITEVFPPMVGGSGRWLWEVYRRQPREEVVIAAGTNPHQEAFDRTHDLRVERIPLALPEVGICSVRGLRGYRRLLNRVRAIVKSHGVDQVHCARCVPEGWIAWSLWQRHGLPYVCYAHGEEVNLSTAGGAPGVMSSRQLRWMTRLVLRSARFTIANSRNTQRILREQWGVSPERLRLLHPGVDPRRFVPAGRDPRVRARLGWGERPVILTAGRLQERKGHDRMILGLHAVRSQVPNVLYAILGDGPERRALQDLVAREGLSNHVVFLGEVDDETLIHCYQQCDLFVLPNRQVGNDIEGFGMVLIEAQACGKPVIAGASGGTVETMCVPETGRVVPCDAPHELAILVAELLQDHDLLHRMGQNARQWVVERFGWDAISGQAQRLFGVGASASGPDHRAVGDTDTNANANANENHGSSWSREEPVCR